MHVLNEEKHGLCNPGIFWYTQIIKGISKHSEMSEKVDYSASKIYHRKKKR